MTKLEAAPYRERKSPYSYSINDIEGGVTYLFLNKDMESIDTWTACKDYFNNMIYTQIYNEQKSEIICFNSMGKIDLDNIIIGVRRYLSFYNYPFNHEEESLRQFRSCFRYANELLKISGYKGKKLAIDSCYLPKGSSKLEIFFKMPKELLKYPPLTSLVLLAMRKGHLYNREQKVSLGCENIFDYIAVSNQAQKGFGPGNAANLMKSIITFSTVGLDNIFQQQEISNVWWNRKFKYSVDGGKNYYSVDIHGSYGIESFGESFHNFFPYRYIATEKAERHKDLFDQIPLKDRVVSFLLKYPAAERAVNYLKLI